jgi:phosphoglycolate phosphatase
MTGNFSAIIFDFDYTLADSSRGVTECINFALSEMKLPAVPAAAAHRTIGLQLSEAFIRLAGVQFAGKTDEFKRHFAIHADQVMNDLTILFDTVPSTVQRLKGEGKKLAIVSTKYRYRIAEFLLRINLLDYFDVIVGGEDVSCHKPDPEGLHHAIGCLNSSLEESLYVGDSIVDAEAARRAGIPFTAVLSGVTRREEFAGYPLAAVIDNLGHLKFSSRP